MKRCSLFLGITLLTATACPSWAGTRDAQWKQVQDAIARGLPRTAITNLDPIIEGALRDHAYGEAAKAIARKLVLTDNIQGNKPEEKILRLQGEITNAPAAMKPLLQTILADWYWQYFQQNRWRFLQRTQTAQAPGNDFTTWDLPRLFAEIDRQFQEALSARQFLQKTPVGDWDELLVKGTMPNSYRPTLYDFIVHEALEFYSSGEQAGARPEDAFELPVGDVLPGVPSPFAGAEEYMSSNDRDQKLSTDQRRELEAMRASSTGKAYFLFQDLLRFHRADPAPRTAFAAADLERLTWVWNEAVGDEKDARYQAALEAFIRANSDLDVSALALEREGRLLQGKDDLAAARQLARRGEQLFPNSPGGKLCHNLAAEIEAKSVSIQTEEVWNKPFPDVTIQYRNLTNIHFRVVAWDWNDFLDHHRSRPENLTPAEYDELLAKPAVLEWSASLPPTPDFKTRAEELPTPETLKKGHYFLIASPDAGFSGHDNELSCANFWVSDLALVTRSRGRNIEGFVLNAISGEPIHGAAVQGWRLDDFGNRVPDPKVETDEMGFFSLNVSDNPYRGRLLRVRDNGDELGSQQEFMAYGGNVSPPRDRAVFFTDRALYRPGQTVQYKGICLSVDQARNNYKLLPGRVVTVVFSDPNGKEIARQRQQANDYGSFSGSFTAPLGRVAGRHRIHADNGFDGAAFFNVEEYKRPKFQVTLDAPKTAPKLGDKVVVGGKAESYTGAAIDNAGVAWRVAREVRFPWWCWWGWIGFQGNASQEIAHGSARTAADGSFKIEFTAKPDASVAPTNEPTFRFTVSADVTDPTGETRSHSRDVVVGYTALQIVLKADDWQAERKPVELSLTSASLDGEPQRAEGSIKVYRLQEPPEVCRPSLNGSRPQRRFGRFGRGVVSQAARPARATDEVDWSDPNAWPLGELASEKGWTTDAEGKAKLEINLGAGLYRAMLETQDRFGKKVTARLGLRVLSPEAPKLGLRIANVVEAPKWSVEPGDEFMALWGTGYDEGRAFVEIEHRQKIVQRYWTKPGQTQQQIKIPVNEDLRGGFQIHVTQARENRAYLFSRSVDVPWSNKELDLKWEHFVSKLQPGQKETWTLEIHPSKTGAQAEVRAAEMVATLYDASLDQYLRHDWPGGFGVFYQDSPGAWNESFENALRYLQQFKGNFDSRYEPVEVRYRRFPNDLVVNWWGYQFDDSDGTRRKVIINGINRFGGGFGGGGGGGGFDSALANAPVATPTEMIRAKASAAVIQADPSRSIALAGEINFGVFDKLKQSEDREPGASPGPVDLSQVSARKNLNETAFFFPQLTSDSNGVVRIAFTMPEALTTWRFLGFAHDRDLRSGLLDDKAVTAKDLMVQPNPPRFLREGDQVEFTVKVSNQSPARQSGKARLTFNYAANDQSADKDLGNLKPELSFDIPAKESRSFAWRIKVPDGCGFLTYKAVGSTGRISDGEEGYVPVLSRRIFVTESLPLPIRGKAGGGEVIKKFRFDKLLKSGGSKTLQNEGLTVQMVSQPAWYAVMALPYLMEYPYECSEQTFNRLYANALARSIANSDPKIRRVFDQWKATPALVSPLEKNQDLKMVSIEETPWYRQAQNESQARRNVGVLFDANRLDGETQNTLRKLTDMQLGDGSWPWFPGGLGNDYITLYITTGFGRLRHLDVDVPVDAAIRSLNRLDNWLREHYEEIQRRSNPEEYVPGPTDAFYLYGRSFFLKDRPIAASNQAAIDFFLNQSRKFWLRVNDRQSQGHLALALFRWGGDRNKGVAVDIMKSIKERSVTSEEMGMFWRETELSWWWYRAPIETQALMIEAFDEITSDSQAVEECRVWLLKQKQTQDWKTTKATADAVYGLLLRGRNLLASDKLVEVTVGGIQVTPKAGPVIEGGHGQATAPEPGTGFYERRFSGPEVKPAMGEITVRKLDEGVSWGSVHWQYLEDMAKVTPYAGTPLTLKKSLYTKVNTSKGPTLQVVKGPLAVGDELVVRIELRVDRDMEYVHLKDQRGSGVEPVNVISQYKYQDGLRYYESTRDTASHFFIDYLPKGTYVFEYSTRVQLRGEYQTGIAEIQCMYAPEFNSHSESIGLIVR